MTATHRLGKDFRLMIGSGTGTPETFTTLSGENTLSVKGSSDKIDTSSKDDGMYKTMTYGQKELTISVQGTLKLPDPGFARLYAVQKSALPELNAQIQHVPSNTTIFAAPVAVGNWSNDFPDKGNASYSFDLTLAGVPTTDDLSSLT